MNPFAFFVDRPVATTLLTLALALAGAVAFKLLPVAPLPRVEFPTIQVQAYLPGASPETMATAVATPLEHSLGLISGVTEMTSRSSLGTTGITLQFDLNRSIDGAARDVQAAINASRAMLPSGMPTNPGYRKINPADASIMILALTSDTMTRGEMYDAASTVLAQKLAQVQGVGLVDVGGASLPAVRVAVNPTALNKYGIGLEDVRTAIATSNANRPKGALEEGERHWQIHANDQASKAREYLPLVIAYRNGAAVRLGDVATASDSIQDVRNAGSSNGEPAVIVLVRRQPGANIIETVDRVNAIMPSLRASIPPAMKLDVVSDGTITIRASLREAERSLALSIGLVIMVAFLFLRNARAVLIPAIAIPLSLLGTFGVMYLAGYSLDNLTLMALTVATGFVVDDAVVVLENIMRHIERGESPFAAARQGVREVGFTVVSMTLSLIAAFLPILLMGGLMGRLFRSFAVTLSAAIVVSLIVSLTTTPMMCARLLRPGDAKASSTLQRWLERGFNAVLTGYRVSLAWALKHWIVTVLLLIGTVALNIHLYKIVPGGFLPQQDGGRLLGFVQADQSISFIAMQRKLATFLEIVKQDPAVANVVGFTGGGQRNSASIFVSLKPLAERRMSSEQVIAGLRRKLGRVPGANLYLQAVQDVRIGGRASNAQFQYTLQADTLEDMRIWEARVRQVMLKLPMLTDVNTDQQDKGLQTTLVIDRDSATRLGITPRMIDATLNDAFGQRQVSVIYNPMNQYRVVLEVAPEFLQSADSLSDISIMSANGVAVPLASVARWEPGNTALAVNHQGLFVASTISFGLAPGIALSQASEAIEKAVAELGLPPGVRGSFQGSAKAFQASQSSQGLLILAAIVTVYIVLGILYESLLHPLTILLSSLPSAGVGALLALLALNTEFTIIALVGVILLIGIVKKNAILMIDFALDAQRHRGLAPEQAIFQACILRFRPIMMTSLAALFGALPLALGQGDGAELRQPLGITIVGGLLLSQVLTLYTTPVVYVCLEWLRPARLRARRRAVLAGA